MAGLCQDGGMTTVTLTKHHHACVTLASGDTRILVDPGSLGEAPSIEGIDAILITHDHFDHVRPELIAQALAEGIPVWLPADAAGRLGLEGEGVHLAEHGDAFAVGSIKVSVLGDEHAPLHPTKAGPQNRAYLVDGRILITGDEHADAPGPVDVLITPADAPWLRSVDLISYIQRLTPRLVIGVHDGLVNEAGRKIATKNIAALTGEGAKEATIVAEGDSIEL